MPERFYPQECLPPDTGEATLCHPTGVDPDIDHLYAGAQTALLLMLVAGATGSAVGLASGESGASGLALDESGLGLTARGDGAAAAEFGAESSLRRQPTRLRMVTPSLNMENSFLKLRPGNNLRR